MNRLHNAFVFAVRLSRNESDPYVILITASDQAGAYSCTYAAKFNSNELLAIPTGRPMSLRSVTGTIDGILTAAMLAFLVCCMAAMDFPHPVAITGIGCAVLAGAGALQWMEYRHRNTIQTPAE